MSNARCPCLLTMSFRFEFLVTASAVSTVAVTASAGLVRFPQGPDDQHHNSDQYGDHDHISNDSGHDQTLLSGPINSRRRQQSLSDGNDPLPDSLCEPAAR